MPRPQRIQAREAAIVAPKPEDEDQSGVQTPPIDEGEENAQTLRSGPVEDGDFIQSLAKRAGWSEEKERDGKPIKDWQDARTFLDRLPDVLQDSRERLRRTTQMADAVAEDARQRGQREAREQLNVAVDSGNKEEAQAAAARLAQHQAPRPETAAWMSRNPWFRLVNGQIDPRDEATSIAVAAIQSAEARGATPIEALQAAETAAKRLFPQYFSNGHQVQAEPAREPRLSQVAPPMVAGGSRGGTGKTTKERGWAELPAQVRGSMDQFVRKAVRRGQTEEQSRSFLAKAYWAEKA